MTPTAPIICLPIGTLPLSQVDAFPPAAARDLEQAHEIRTLFDLQPHVEKLGGDVDAVRKTFIGLGVRKEHLDQCTWSLLRHLNPGGVPEAAKKEKKPRASGVKVTRKMLANGSATILQHPAGTIGDQLSDAPIHGEGLTPSEPADGTSAPASPSPTEQPGGAWVKLPCPQHAKRFHLECPACNAKNATYVPPAPEGKSSCVSTSAMDAASGNSSPAREEEISSSRPTGTYGPTTTEPKSPVAASASTRSQSKPERPESSCPSDFDENTPPPRTRPSSSDPVPRYVKLHAGESPIAKAGRIPAGSVLCKCVWTDFGARSGYQVEASIWPPPLGEPGEEIAIETLKGWYCRVSIMLIGNGNFAVMSREGT